ncbi:hypothetical protein CPT_Mater201 [Bacillus phage Mater]|uniref:Uncharacterized protein n=1 Tax=Bacillus phage Mater TaxID=1540090 RepID=A0A0A0RUU8_9CAUD|nr:hypothetical protein CPT_Mater201 [Bacillus phage Mater]AIW03358.1 hypothetical protein CPT_Mater201 [Bacillus phage Mater]
MSEERKTLLDSLKDQIQFFKERKTVGRMVTEHSIFIPTALMRDQAKETEEFIKVAKTINNSPALACPVIAEPHETGRFTGVNFVFSFRPNTDFDMIIEIIEGQA